MKTSTPLQSLVSRVADRLSLRNDSSALTEKNPRPLVIEALEPRILFSGSPAPAPEAAPAEAPAVQESAADAAPEASAPAVEEAAVAAPPAAAPSEEVAADAGSGDTAITLTDTELAALTDAASGIWASSGLTEEQVAALSSASYQIADLGGNVLGSAEGNLITIDDDAAGRGWFVDGTPDDDSEFVSGGSATTGVDLLSVLLHEQGHLLGLDDSGAAAGDVMFEEIGSGERRLPGDGAAAGAIAGNLGGIHFLTFGPVTEDFEGEASGDKTFTDQTVGGGPTFDLVSSGVFELFSDNTFAQSGSNFIDTFSGGTRSGDIGSIVVESGWAFEAGSIAVALGDSSGDIGGTDTVTFTGTEFGTGTEFTHAPSIDSSSGYSTVNFAGTDLENVLLTELKVSLPASPSAGYIYLDDFAYTADDNPGGGGGGGGGVPTTLAFTDFNDSAIGGSTNIKTGLNWVLDGVDDPGDMAALNAGGNAQTIFDGNAFVQDIFIPGLNTGNGNTFWTVDVPITVAAGADVTLTDVTFNSVSVNGGQAENVDRRNDYTVTLIDTSGGTIEEITIGDTSAGTGDGQPLVTFDFTDVALTESGTYILRIKGGDFVAPDETGNHTGLDNLSINGTIAAAGPTTITAGDGNGADSYVRLGQATTNFGAADHIVIKDSNNGSTTRKGYLRFDLSTATGSISAASLDLVVSINNEGGGGSTPQTHTVEVYGLTDESLDNWDESTINFSNAPGNAAGDSFDLSKVTLLGSFTVPSTPVGGALSFTSTGLADFLNSDTNGLATILLRREGGNGSHNLAFASEENATYDPASLVLTFATTGGLDAVDDPSYEAAVLADNPLGYWRLGESAGATVAADASGNGNDLDYQNGAGANLGQPGAISDGDTAATLVNGGTDQIQSPNTTDFAFASGESFSIEYWAKFESGNATANEAGLVTKGYDAAQSRPWYLSRLNTAGTVDFFLRDVPGNNRVATSTTNVEDGEWHHVVGVYDAGAAEVRIYVDGALEGTATGVPPADYGTNAGAFSVGNHLNRQVDGQIDEVAVYGGALTQAQIDAHLAASSPVETDEDTVLIVAAPGVLGNDIGVGGGGGGGLVGELGILDLAANGGINPNTGVAWEAGDEYRLVFVTSGTTNATSTNITTYNDFVQTTADTAGLGAATWNVIGSTQAVNARVNTSTTGTGGEAILLIDGSTVIATDYGDFWNGHDVATEQINLDENGDPTGGLSVFTGTTSGGATVTDRYFGTTTISNSQLRVTTGRTDANTTGRWAQQFNAAPTATLPLYALSDVLTVSASSGATITAFDATSANGAAVTVNPDGSFTYDPTGSATLQALNNGDSIVDTFNYTITDPSDLGSGSASLSTGATVEISDNSAGFDISVFPGKAGYEGSAGNTGTFGDGTVLDYRFFNNTGTTFNDAGYANGGGGIVGTATATDSSGLNGGALNWADVWTAGDPDSDPANFTSDTVARSQGVTGTIDISGLVSGSVDFIYGSFTNPNTLTLTMTGSGQPDIIATHTEDPPATNKGWTTNFTFDDASLYDTITYTYTNTDTDGSRARFMGVVVDGLASATDTATVSIQVNGVTDAAPPSIDSNPGDVSIFTEGTGTDAITNSDFNNDFDTTVRSAPSHTLTGSGDGIEVSAGHHLVIYNATFEKAPGGSEDRSEIQSNLNLNGNDLAAGWSQGYIRLQNNQNETITAGGGIINVANDGDVLQLQSFRTDTDTNPTTRSADGTGIQLIKLDDNWDYLSLAGNDGSGTDQAITDSTTIWTDVVYNQENEKDTGSFDYASGTGITLKEQGHYLVFANTYAYDQDVSNRTAIIQRLNLDGNEVSGSKTTVYLRGNNNATILQNTDEGAASIGMILESTGANQVLNVQILQDVARTGMVIDGDRTGITIVKLPDDVDYLSLIDTSGDQNLNSTTELNYDDATSQLEVDPSFTHSVATDPSQVTVNSDGDYLFLTSAFDAQDAAQRGFYNQQWNVNGGTPPAYGQTGQYSRNGGGADQFGNWSGAVFELNSGDYVESTSRPLGNGGTNTADTLAMQAVNLTALFAPRGAFDDLASANEDAVLDITDPLGGVLANDEVDGTVIISDTTSDLGASVIVNPDGTYTYDPTAVTLLQNLPGGGSVTDTFTYGRGAPEVTPGADFFVDAGQDTDGDSRWEDLTAGNPSGLDFNLVGGVTRVAGVSSLPGIDAAYDLPGGATGNNDGALLSFTGGGPASFQNAAGDWTNNEDVTIEIWFKPDNLTPTPANGQILFEDGGGRGLGLFIDDGNLEYRRANVNAEISTDITGLGGEFIQAVATYNIGTGAMELFVNGQSVGTATSGGDWSGGDDAGLGTRGAANTGGIGGGQSATESFDGQIAIMRVYRDQILTAPEVQDNFGSVAYEQTEVNGLQGYWTLDSTAALDSSGNGRDGTLTGNLATGNPVAGQIDNAIDFDTTTNHVEITGYKGVTGTAPRSLSAWVLFEGTNANQGIMHWGTNSGGQKWTFRTQDGNGPIDGNIRIEVNGGYIVGSTDIRDGQWHMVTAVFDPGSVSSGAEVEDIRLYVDGQLETVSAILNRTVNTAVGNDVRIGLDENNRDWEGLIDDAAIWDRVLSDAEIAEIFSVGQDNGAFQNIATVTVTVAGENDVPVANDDLINVGENAAGSGNVLTNDVEVDGATPGMTLNFEASADTDGAIWEDTAGVVADWNFDSLSGTAPALVSVTSGRGQITQAYQFTGGETGGDAAFELHRGTGTVSLQDLPGNASNNSATFELWFKPDSLPLPDGGSTNTRQILFEDGGGTGIGLFVEGTELVLKKLPGTGEIRYDISGIADDFIQAAWTFNRGPNPDNLQLYVNGELVGTDPTANNGNDFSGGDGAAIGGRGENNVGGQGGGDSSSESFQGQVAVFRFYESILNAAEVQRNYVAIENGFAPVAIASVETLPSGAIATVAEDGTFTYDPNGAFEDLAAGETATDTFEYTVVDGDSSEVTLALAEFTTAAQNDNVGDDSPAESGAFAGADLYVRDRANENNPELEVEAFLKFDLSGVTGPITNATLNLHEFHKLNSVNSANLNLARVLAPWDSTGNDPVHSEAGAPTAVVDEFVFGNNGPANAGPAVDIDHAIDITSWVNGWLADPGSNYGVRLRIDAAFVGAAFDSTGPDAPNLVLAVPLATDTGTVTVTITGANDTPVAKDNDYTTDEDNTVSGAVITDDTGDGVDSDVDTSDVPYVESIDTTSTLGQVTMTLPKVIGEVGNLATNSLTDSTNPTQTLNNTFVNPVVLATPPTENGADSSVVRITSISANSFSATLAEAPNHGPGHLAETVDFTVFESGQYTLSDGTKIVVGIVDATGNVFETVSFGGFFTGTPVVMTQIQSLNDTVNTFVKTRQDNTSAASFDVKLERAEGDGNHGTETIGYIAIEPGSGTVGGLIYDAATTAQNIDETYDRVDFDRNFGTAPNLVAALASYAGGDPTGLRYRNIDGTGVEFLAEEDTNSDTELVHADESVSYLALGGDGDIIGFDAADYNGTGAFTYDPNGQFDNLNPGETATDTFTYTLGNGPISGSLLEGLEGYWKLDSTAATDSSGNGRDGTLTGNLATGNPVAGQVDGAIDFNTTTDRVNIDGYKGVTGSDPRSMAAWVRFEGTNPNQGIMSWGTNSSFQKWTFRTQDTNFQDGAIRLEVNGAAIVGSTDIRDGQWHHVAAVFDPGSVSNGATIQDVRLYVDGQLEASNLVNGNFTTINTAVANDVRIGLDENIRDWEGLIDEAAIWSRALSDAEIAGVFSAGQAMDSLLANTGTVTVTVTGLNDAPVLVSTNDFDDVTVNNTDNAGNTVDDLIGLITDADDNSLEGIAITGTTVNGTGAVFEFSTNAGGSWSAVGSVSETNALLLRATDLVRFSPDGTAQVDGSIEFKAWDQTGSTTGDEGTKTTTVPDGGSSPFSTEVGVSNVKTVNASIENGVLVYGEAEGRNDLVHIYSDGVSVIIHDDAGPISASGDGTQEDPNTVSFLIADFEDIRFEANDFDDTITIGDMPEFDGSLTIDGEDGFDSVTFAAGMKLALGTGLSDGGADENLDVDAETVKIDFDAALSVVGDGTIDITATGGGAEDFIGLQLKRASLTSADGAITLVGEGGSVGNHNDGVQINVGSTITTTGGSVSITGTATSTVGQNDGVSLVGGSDVTVGGAGTITIEGTSSGVNDSYGVLLFSGTTLTSNTGEISVTGSSASSGPRNSGVYTNGATVITTGGSITLDGAGNGAGSGNDNNGLRLTATSIGAGGAGGVTLTGTGGSGTNSNVGVEVGVRTEVTTASGNIVITGTGGAGTGVRNRGAEFQSLSSVISGGDLNITGTAGTGTSYNEGFYAIGATLEAAGTVTIIGAADGSGSRNSGVSATRTTITGGGDVNITGTGSTDASGRFNSGIILNRATVSASANLFLLGNGGTGNGHNRGIYGVSSDLSGGTFDIMGTADATTTGRGNAGVSFLNTMLSDTGTITGAAGGSAGASGNFGVFLQNLASGLSVNDVTGTSANNLDDALGGNYFNILPALLLAAGADKVARNRKRQLAGLIAKLGESTAGEGEMEVYREEDGIIGLEATLATEASLEAAGVKVPATGGRTRQLLVLTGGCEGQVTGVFASVDGAGKLVSTSSLKLRGELTASELMGSLEGCGRSEWSQSPRGTTPVAGRSFSEAFGIE